MQVKFIKLRALILFLRKRLYFFLLLILTLLAFSLTTLIKSNNQTIEIPYTPYNYPLATSQQIPLLNFQNSLTLLNKDISAQTYHTSTSNVDLTRSSLAGSDELSQLTQLLYLPLIFSSRSTIYYVDNSCTTNGNGKTETCGSDGPFNSLANAQVIVTGNQSDNFLLFKKGQTFSGQYNVEAYGNTGHPFTISSYGTGAKPNISGGNSNIVISCDYCQNIIVDGIEFSSSTGRHNILINYPASHITIKNCYSHHSPDAAITIFNSSDNIIADNEFSWNGREGIIIDKEDINLPTNGNIIRNNRSHNNMRYGIFVLSNPPYMLDGSTTKIYSNESYNNSTGIYLANANGIEIYDNNLHDNGMDCQGINDCLGEDYGFAIQSGSYNDFHDNIITRTYNTGLGIYGDQETINGNSDGNRIYRNSISNTILGYWKRDINFQARPGNSVGNNNLIYYNIVWGNGQNFVIGDTNPNISGNKVYNNVFYGGSDVVTFEGTSSNSGWTFINNIFDSDSHLSIYADHQSGLTLHNNIYYSATGGTLVMYNNSKYDSTNILSLDINAIVTDPRFIGITTWFDFQLQSTSPAIDRGINLGSPFNFAINPTNNIWPPFTLDQNSYGSGWEIGAFGYTK